MTFFKRHQTCRGVILYNRTTLLNPSDWLCTHSQVEFWLTHSWNQHHTSPKPRMFYGFDDMLYIYWCNNLFLLLLQTSLYPELLASTYLDQAYLTHKRGATQRDAVLSLSLWVRMYCATRNVMGRESTKSSLVSMCTSSSVQKENDFVVSLSSLRETLDSRTPKVGLGSLGWAIVSNLIKEHFTSKGVVKSEPRAMKTYNVSAIRHVILFILKLHMLSPHSSFSAFFGGAWWTLW